MCKIICTRIYIYTLNNLCLGSETCANAISILDSKSVYKKKMTHMPYDLMFLTNIWFFDFKFGNLIWRPHCLLRIALQCEQSTNKIPLTLKITLKIVFAANMIYLRPLVYRPDFTIWKTIQQKIWSLRIVILFFFPLILLKVNGIASQFAFPTF